MSDMHLVFARRNPATPTRSSRNNDNHLTLLPYIKNTNITAIKTATAEMRVRLQNESQQPSSKLHTQVQNWVSHVFSAVDSSGPKNAQVQSYSPGGAHVP